MRLSDLLQLEAVNEDGRRLGHVHDVRFSGNGDPDGWDAESLIVGRAGFTARLGYAHGEVEGPWLFGYVLRWMARKGLEIPWDRVVSLDDDRVVVAGRWNDFAHPAAGRKGP